MAGLQKVPDRPVKVLCYFRVNAVLSSVVIISL